MRGCRGGRFRDAARTRYRESRKAMRVSLI
jgi:hypothetical protein